MILRHSNINHAMYWLTPSESVGRRCAPLTRVAYSLEYDSVTDTSCEILLRVFFSENMLTDYFYVLDVTEEWAATDVKLVSLHEFYRRIKTLVGLVLTNIVNSVDPASTLDIRLIEKGLVKHLCSNERPHQLDID